MKCRAASWQPWWVLSKRQKVDANSEEIYREVLDIYGLVRMTAQVRKRFEEAAAQP